MAKNIEAGFYVIRFAMIGSLMALAFSVASCDVGAPLSPGARPAEVPDSLVGGWNQRANILVIVADDLSWLHMGWMGDPTARTPNLDRLAREGARFTNAYASTSSCSGSRAAILTGIDAFLLGDAINLGTPIPGEFDLFPDLLEGAGYEVGFALKGWAPGPVSTGRNPAGPRFPDFRRFLDRRDPAAPFLFWHGSRNPHRPYEEGAGAAAGFDPLRVELPPHLPDDPRVRGDFADYHQEVAQFDQEVGILLDELAERDLEDETLVIVTSDNGMPFPRCKTFLYDCGVRMPLLVRWPGVVAPDRRVEDLVSLLDLAPTVLSAAGVERPGGMRGRSLVARIDEGGVGAVLMARERHAADRLEDGYAVGYPMRAIRTADYLYIRNYRPDRTLHQDVDSSSSRDAVLERLGLSSERWYYDLSFGPRPAEELYRVRDDEWQLTNLVGRRSHAAVLARMRRTMSERLRSLGDPRAAGHGSVFDQGPVYFP